MYAYIKGTLADVNEEEIIVENAGIGYRIRVPLLLLEGLPPLGSEVKIYTHLYVREDAFSLFGFSSKEEIGLFKLLINVSGIGPKGALSILSVLSPADLRFAILSEDVKSISTAPGVGKKSAQRLIIELKDKVGAQGFDVAASIQPTAAPGGFSNAKKEAMEALVALGYSAADAAKALNGLAVSEEMDAEEILKLALKQLAFL